VYRWAASAWQRLPELPGGVRSLRVSPNGVVAAMAYAYGKSDVFVRFDGAVWKTCGVRRDLSISNDDCALDGEDVGLLKASIADLTARGGK
jgi:hypothetical protein